MVSHYSRRRYSVVHLINHLGYGGSERQLFLVLTSFDRRHFEHRVVVFNPSPERVYDDHLREVGVEVSTLPPTCTRTFDRVRFLQARFQTWQPDIVHSWTVHDNPYAALAGRLGGVPVRWGSLRGSPRSDGLRRIPRPIRSLMVRSVQRLVVNSQALATELKDCGYPTGHVFVLPNCVKKHSPVQPANLDSLGIGRTEAVIGLVGNLRAIKNHSLFVRAMATVLPSRPGVKAAIVGQPIASEPNYQSEIEDKIQRLGLSQRIVMTGFRDDIPGIMQRLSILCLTSHSEGMPNAVLEAMAAGVPVVATRVGGVSELVKDGKTGFVIEPGDELRFSQAVARILDDADLANSMGNAARDRATTEFGCERAAERLASGYEMAVRQKAP